jgi:hypothetical protein
MCKTKAKASSAEEFEERFDAGEDALELTKFRPVDSGR